MKTFLLISCLFFSLFLSISFTINFANAAIPVVDNAFLSSLLGANATDEDLILTYSVSDNDGDDINNIIKWMVNNNPIMSLYIPFEGGALAEGNTKVKDYALGKHGSIFGTVFNPFGGINSTGAYEFDGIKNRIEINNFNQKLDNFTLSMWVKPNFNFDDNSKKANRFLSARGNNNPSLLMGYNNLNSKFFLTQADKNSWTNTGDLNNSTVVRSLLESSDGSLYAATGSSGDVFRSVDGGVSWVNTGDLAGATYAYSLLESSDGSLYAGTQPNGDVFKSIDKGVTWVNTGDLAGATYAYSLLESFDGSLYAGTVPFGDVFRSVDGGVSWVNTSDLAGTNIVYSLLESSDGSLYAGTQPNGDVFKSIDKGVTWVNTGDLANADMIYSLLESSDGSLYAGTYPFGEVFKSVDKGKTWINTTNLPGATRVYSLLESFDGSLYAGTVPFGDVFRSVDGGVSWVNTGDLAGATYAYSLLESSDGSLYAGTIPAGDIFVTSNKKLDSNVQSFASGDWIYLTITKDDNSISFYVNGVLVNSSNDIFSSIDISTLFIGGDAYSQESDGGYQIGRRTAGWNGSIDEFIIFNRSLSSAQIQALYQNKTNIIVAEETEPGDNWSACVTPNDRTEDGLEVCSNNLNILNNSNPPDAGNPADANENTNSNSGSGSNRARTGRRYLNSAASTSSSQSGVSSSASGSATSSVIHAAESVEQASEAYSINAPNENNEEVIANAESETLAGENKENDQGMAEITGSAVADISNPVTSQKSRVALAISLMLISAFLICVITYYLRQKKIKDY